MSQKELEARHLAVCGECLKGNFCTALTFLRLLAPDELERK